MDSDIADEFYARKLKALSCSNDLLIYLGSSKISSYERKAINASQSKQLKLILIGNKCLNDFNIEYNENNILLEIETTDEHIMLESQLTIVNLISNLVEQKLFLT